MEGIKIDSTFLKERAILPNIKKLVTAIQIEKQCSKKDACEDAALFLKQLIYILTSEE